MGLKAVRPGLLLCFLLLPGVVSQTPASPQATSDSKNALRTAEEHKAALKVLLHRLRLAQEETKGVLRRYKKAKAMLSAVLASENVSFIRDSLKEVARSVGGGRRNREVSDALDIAIVSARGLLAPLPVKVGQISSEYAMRGQAKKKRKRPKLVVWPAVLGDSLPTEEEMQARITSPDLTALTHQAAQTAARRLSQPNIDAASLAVFNPSITPLPKWAQERLGTTGKGALLVVSKIAGFHSCHLNIDEEPNLEDLPESAWVGEIGWAVLNINEKGGQLRAKLRASGGLSGLEWQGNVKVRRVSQYAGPSRERVSTTQCMAEDPRLFALRRPGSDEQELWVSWVVAGREDGWGKCPTVAWPLAQRTFLTPIRILPARGGHVEVEAVANRTVQLSLPGFSQECQSEKNINFFTDRNSEVWAEYVLEPHIMCKVDLTTGMCTSYTVTSAGLRGRLRGTTGFVPIKFQGEELLLGIGHVNHQRADGKWSVRKWRYSSFLYAFESQPPFAMRAWSAEFCFPYEAKHKYPGREHGWCPSLFSHQMAMGMAWKGESLLVSFGEQDCTSRFTMLPRSWILKALQAIDKDRIRLLAPEDVIGVPETEACRRLTRRRWPRVRPRPRSNSTIRPLAPDIPPERTRD